VIDTIVLRRRFEARGESPAGRVDRDASGSELHRAVNVGREVTPESRDLSPGRRDAALRWSLQVVAVGLAGTLMACGSGGQSDAIVGVTVQAPMEMPFHGPGGPGTEPMYISFDWTVVISASEGSDGQIGTVRTLLTERVSGGVLVAEASPMASLRGGEKVELKQQASGTFPSALYPGDWTGVTSVEVTHISGRQETVSTSFRFR
jgi:hypothetical protein